MSKLSIKRFAEPDKSMQFGDHGHLEMIDVGGRLVGLAQFEPGWRWSKDVKPKAGTDSCQSSHETYVISGTLHIRMDDGEEIDIKAGEVAEIPPGHDAWVVGDLRAVAVDFGDMEGYGQRAVAVPKYEQPEARH